MPRKTRMYVPDIPVHVVQRGNNRDVCFFCEDEYRKAYQAGLKCTEADTGAVTLIQRFGSAANLNKHA